MSGDLQPVEILFHTLGQFSAALREQVGPNEAAIRMKLVQELLAYLPQRCLLATTKAEIQAAGKTMKAAGHGREDMAALQSTLVALLDELSRAGAVLTHPLRDAGSGSERRRVIPRVALIVGLRPEQAAALAEILATVGVSALAEASHEQAQDTIGWYPFAFILASMPPFAPVLFLEAVRGAGSLCRTSGLVLMVRETQVEEASSFVGRGVNRVVAFSAVARRLPRMIGDLGKVSERVSVQVEVQVELDDGSRVGPWLSDNISSTGMLVRTSDGLAKGTQLDLRFTLPDDRFPIDVRAEVVRSATFGREKFAGLGLRFLSFVGEGQLHLDSSLGRRPSS